MRGRVITLILLGLFHGTLPPVWAMERESIDPLQQLSTFKGYDYDFSLGPAGIYTFYYSLPQSSRYEERTSSGEVKGNYAYVAPEGDEFKFEYEAGKKGFQVESNALPVPPEDTEEVKRARAAFFDAYKQALAVVGKDEDDLQKVSEDEEEGSVEGEESSEEADLHAESSEEHYVVEDAPSHETSEEDDEDSEEEEEEEEEGGEEEGEGGGEEEGGEEEGGEEEGGEEEGGKIEEEEGGKRKEEEGGKRKEEEGGKREEEEMMKNDKPKSGNGGKSQNIHSHFKNGFKEANLQNTIKSGAEKDEPKIKSHLVGESKPPSSRGSSFFEIPKYIYRTRAQVASAQPRAPATHGQHPEPLSRNFRSRARRTRRIMPNFIYY